MLPLFLSASSAIRRPIREIPVNAVNAELKSFDQILDHFDQSSKQTFKQRYYINEKYGKIADGTPIILDIGGESDGFGVPGQGDFEEVIAQKFNATVVSLEHRFYGGSYPFEESTTENLQYLTVAQAVEDLAYFAQYIIDTMHASKNKWMLYGGSYPGLLSAYTKSKYPDIFSAAVSSSGVVLAQKEFKDFDRQIEISLGHQCSVAARTARRHIDELLETDPDYVLNLFNAVGVEPEIFRFVVGEMFSLAPQYGRREAICTPLEDALVTGKDPMMALAEYNRNFFIPTFIGKSTIAAEYSTAALKSTKNKGARSWLWQTCHELAWWQVAPGKTTLRSPKVTKEVFANQCKEVFGLEQEPDVDAFNAVWGGLNQNGTNIFYVTGSMDPWSGVCITDENVPAGCFAHTVTGPNIGHCVDYHYPSPTETADLQRTRKAIIDALTKWLGL